VGLLALTRMRAGEAIRPDCEDFDDQARGANDGAKFGKSRQLPLHPTTTARLGDYLDLRDQLCSHSSRTALLLPARGCRLRYERSGRPSTSWSVMPDCDHVRRMCSTHPRPAPHFRGPTLLERYRDGADVPALLPRVSASLGHADPKQPCWYLSATPELLALAAARLHAHQPGRRGDLR
jgi:integrase/recombinase XerD